MGVNKEIGAGWLYDAFSVRGQNNLTDLINDAGRSGVWSFGGYSVQAYYSRPVSLDNCQLQFVSYILYAVIACNLVKVLCMCETAHMLGIQGESILATIGDAIASFVDQSDTETKDMCLLNRRNLRRNYYWVHDPVYKSDKNSRLYSTTSHMRYWIAMCTCTAFVIGIGACWLRSTKMTEYTMSELMHIPFGAVDRKLTLGHEGESGTALLYNVVLANSPQFALSFIYYLYNGLWTAQCGALEWASYVTKRKGLRVSWRKGNQRSSYYLQIPYRYGVPLLILSITLHFLISQSIFIAAMRYYGEDDGFSDIGYSPRAILTTFCVATVIIVAQVVFSLRRIDGRIPFHGNKSAVISAACHPGRTCRQDHGAEDRNRVSTLPLKWGAFPLCEEAATNNSKDRDGDDTVGHCGFSADPVELPTAGHQYF